MSFIKFLVAKKCKTYEIYSTMCDVYGEEWFSQKMFMNGLNIGLLLGSNIEKNSWLDGNKLTAR